ncbi:hypothetical protein HZB60_10600 [candidate division KSB1 bacterium]|nr:hypothetical protein [candidate division KSB1 bacterium]
MSPKRCIHCQKPIPLRKRFSRRCPFCFKAFRRRSGISERGTAGQWMEDRGKSFWFLLLSAVLVIGGAMGQILGQPDLINFIDARPVWFFVSVFWLAMFASVIGRIFFPLLLGAPTILRKERHMIRQYKTLTAIGFVLGVVLAVLMIGADRLWQVFPGTAFLVTVPIALMWGYLALVLQEGDYDDDRVWSFLSEIGASDRLEHRQNGYFALIGLPLAGLLFFYFMTHPWMAWAIRNSTLLAMFRELWRRATDRSTLGGGLG